MTDVTKKERTRPLREERVTFRCPTTLRDAIERAAERDRRTVSDWIVLALERAVTQGGR